VKKPRLKTEFQLSKPFYALLVNLFDTRVDNLRITNFKNLFVYLTFVKNLYTIIFIKVL